MRPTSFDRLAGLCAILAGIGGFLYAVAFVIVSRNDPELSDLLSALLLLVNAILSSAALVGIYGRVHGANPGLALWGLLLGLGGQLGAAMHGGYDLANLIHPLGEAAPGPGDLPFQADPRGLMTFGLTGLAILVLASLIGRTQGFPGRLASLGSLLGVLLVVIYVARLTVLDATNPLLLAPVLVTGFIVSPLWYLWLGRELRQGG